MSIAGTDIRWRRARGVAFVDVGRRVLVLKLVDPVGAKPLLLDGTAAEVWRMLDQPKSALELQPAWIGDQSSAPDTNGVPTHGLLDILHAASLIEAADIRER